jgi:hypothetical protein
MVRFKRLPEASLIVSKLFVMLWPEQSTFITESKDLDGLGGENLL